MNIRIKIPDKEKAISLTKIAKDDLNYTFTLPIIENSSNTIVRNVYESFRMLGEAILTIRGLDVSNHILSINELLKLDVKTSRPTQLLENLRKLRHNINYYGYKAKIFEAQDAVLLAKTCFNPLLNEILKKIKELR